MIVGRPGSRNFKRFKTFPDGNSCDAGRTSEFFSFWTLFRKLRMFVRNSVERMCAKCDNVNNITFVVNVE